MQLSDEPNGKRGPQFLSGSQISLAALRERVEAQFIAETASRPDILLGTNATVRHELIRDNLDYVLATESISLSRADRLLALDVIYHDLFDFGPLYSALIDETVTEFTIDGPDRIYIRHNAQEMVVFDAAFDDAAHLERVVGRVLAIIGTQVSQRDPVLELGVELVGRPSRLTIIAPPISPLLHVDGRLHPLQKATLESCIASGMIDETAAQTLQAILRAGHGMMIVGDVGTGKTTLLGALLPDLSSTTVVVERAQELRVPESMTRFAAVPPLADEPPIEFSTQIEAALEKSPSWLVMDEVRFDESQAMWHALTANSAPRCLWAFRGATDPMRLRAAFSMSVRRAVPGIEQEFIHSALLDRLPFVVFMTCRDHRLTLLSISEWQRDEQQPDTLALRTIWPESGFRPNHSID
jgi:pilus assembly protein CpaF